MQHNAKYGALNASDYLIAHIVVGERIFCVPFVFNSHAPPVFWAFNDLESKMICWRVYGCLDMINKSGMSS